MTLKKYNLNSTNKVENEKDKVLKINSVNDTEKNQSTTNKDNFVELGKFYANKYKKAMEELAK